MRLTGNEGPPWFPDTRDDPPVRTVPVVVLLVVSTIGNKSSVKLYEREVKSPPRRN